MLSQRTYMGSGAPSEDVWFAPKLDFAGTSFTINQQTLRFSFSDTLDYLLGEPGTPIVATGTCRRAAA
ncbi:hypothetical protein [Lysobacter xanthus]